MLAKPVMCVCLMAFSPSLPALAQFPSISPETASNIVQDRRPRGPSISVREIERRVVPRMTGAQYLGFDYDPSADVYTLKFLRNGSVIWVDVDGRSGNIIRRSGN